MTLCFDRDSKFLTLSSRKLLCAGLLSVVMVKARLLSDEFAVLCDLESLCI